MRQSAPPEFRRTSVVRSRDLPSWSSAGSIYDMPNRSVGSTDHHSGSGALVSSSGTFRYLLWRQVSKTNARGCLFVMLNPSSADAEVDDPTVRRCMDFTRRWASGELRLVNLFTLVSVDPRRLAAVPDPVGPGDDDLTRAELTTPRHRRRIGQPRSNQATFVAGTWPNRGVRHQGLAPGTEQVPRATAPAFCSIQRMTVTAQPRGLGLLASRHVRMWAWKRDMD
jgi:hypothetical protein